MMWPMRLQEKIPLITELLKVRGVGETTVEKLKAAGIKSIDDVLAKTIEELSSVEGIGEAKATQLKHDAAEFRKSNA